MSQRTSPEQLYVSEWLCSDFLGINPQRCGISLELDLQRWAELCWASPQRSLLRRPSRCVTAGRGHSFAGSSFPPRLMLIVIKTKQFHDSPSSLHNAGILATCPVVHNQPKPRGFPRFCCCECLEFVLLRALDETCVRSTWFNTGVAGTASEIQPVTIRVWISSAL